MSGSPLPSIHEHHDAEDPLNASSMSGFNAADDDDDRELDEDDGTPSRPSSPAPRGLPRSRSGMLLTPAHLGSRVAVRGFQGAGFLRYIGPEAGKAVVRCGVEMDTFVGPRAVDVTPYFPCDMGRGIMVAPAKVRHFFKK